MGVTASQVGHPHINLGETMTTFDEIRSARKPRIRDAWVPLDGQLLDEIATLEKVVTEAERIDEREHRTPQAPALKRRLEELRDRAADAATRFRFRELPRKAYRGLVDAHPATDADKERGIRAWHEDTFAPALIAACCVEPELSAEQAREIWDEWGVSIAYALFAVAVDVNEGDTAVPFSVIATAPTADSPPSSTSVSVTGAH